MPEKIVEQYPREKEFFNNPYASYAKWRSAGSPFFWKDYDLWCLSDFDQVNKALRDRRFARLPPPDMPARKYATHLRDFAKAERYSLLAMEPPKHSKLRKLVNRAFISRQIERLEPSINVLAHQCIDTFEAGKKVELLEHFATPIPLSVITDLLGVPDTHAIQLLGWSHAMVRVYTLKQSYQEEVAANQAAAQFQSFLKHLIKDKRANPGDDLLSHLLALQNESNAICDEEIISVCILLLNAGHEATVHQLGNAVYTLLQEYPAKRRPELNCTLKDNHSADSLVSECLRFAPPLHLFTRFAQVDVTLDNGVRIAKGHEIGLLLAAANRCPVKFDKPDRFLPERPDADHLSLGAGIHYCVGAHLAKLELRVALQVLFERLPDLKLARRPHLQDSFHFHGLDALHVSW